jgi:EAL domain-containing protein (putative c-di-GMP-specific phosphodiesterase class I)
MTIHAPRARELTFRLRKLDGWVPTDLRGALDRGELAVHYQPIVALATGEITAAEALLRWEHPPYGRVDPAAFIRAAERTGAIHAVGTWVLDVAARAAAGWPVLRPGHRRTVAVNVSAVQLAEPGFADLVFRALDTGGLPATSLVVEVTETATLVDTPSAARRLELLRAAGVRVAVDDVGTGYSLARLHALPVDLLKIDRAFVARLVTDPVSRAIVASVVALAHSLGLEAVAEGVEQQVQLDVLRDLGCDRAQGYLWSPAVPVADFVGMLHAGPGHLANGAARRWS